jgi:RHS repeat-associated protein
MATTVELSENSHQGFDGIKAALCLASTRVNSNTASEMPVCLWRKGIRSRSTGKERDAETGLDYFLARYYSGAQGRFTGPDSPSYSNPKNPQSWNLYAYSLNNPLAYFDPNGHEVVCANNVDQCGNDAANATGSQEAAARVTTKTATTEHKFLFFHWTTSKTTIQINGDINSFRALSQNANRLADLVTSDKFSVSVHYEKVAPISFFTGGTRLEGGSTSRYSDNSWANGPSGWIDARRWDGQGYDPDAIAKGLSQATTAEEFGHEVLGHLWGNLVNGSPVGTKRNFRDAITGENGARKLDPTHGQKGLDSHHDYDKYPE